MTLPTIKTREDLIHVLYKAAELEHGIICQYLFAAFTLKSHIVEGKVTWAQLEQVREWKSAILLIARQEMEHLGLVSNLLTAIGGTAHFRRPNFPHSTPYCPPYTTFELQPFCEATLKRFACFEQLHRSVCHYSGNPVPSQDVTVGMLYEHIRYGFAVVGETLQRNKRGALFIGPSEAQIVNQDLQLPPQGQFDVNLLAAADLQSAVKIIDHIIEAGASTEPQGATSHAERFEQMLNELECMRRQDLKFEPARPVAPNPITCSTPEMTGDLTLITHPVTLQASRLFNLSYITMMQMLTRFYTHVDDSPAERQGLMKTAFFPFMTVVIRPLGEMLTQMPVHDHMSMATAGPSFEFDTDLPLPPFQRSAWTFLSERLETIATSCRDLCLQIQNTDAPWAERIRPRLAFLQDNLEHMVINFVRHMNLRREYAEFLLRKVL